MRRVFHNGSLASLEKCAKAPWFLVISGQGKVEDVVFSNLDVLARAAVDDGVDRGMEAVDVVAWHRVGIAAHERGDETGLRDGELLLGVTVRCVRRHAGNSRVSTLKVLYLLRSFPNTQVYVLSCTHAREFPCARLIDASRLC